MTEGDSRMKRFSVVPLLLFVLGSHSFQSSTVPAFVQAAAPASAPKPVEIAIKDGPIPMRILVQSPADTEADLQIICLFRSDNSNTLHGSLIETNEKLKGLLDRIRKPSLFGGELGETLLLQPTGSLTAKRVLMVGLGDSQTFTPERMELVGAIAYREASRLGVAHPFFAPTILDGGVTKFTTGQVSEQVIGGFFRAANTEKLLNSEGKAPQPIIKDLTYLAGPQYASSTQEGIEKAIATEARK
jgi:Cytosol aminopeptidase family, N-terminal domain